MISSPRQRELTVGVVLSEWFLCALPCQAQLCATNLDCEDLIDCTTDVCDPPNPLARIFHECGLVCA